MVKPPGISNSHNKTILKIFSKVNFNLNFEKNILRMVFEKRKALIFGGQARRARVY